MGPNIFSHTYKVVQSCMKKWLSNIAHYETVHIFAASGHISKNILLIGREKNGIPLELLQ